MSSASSTVTYTSVDTDSEPGRAFWPADEELSDGGSPRVIVYGYDGLPIQPVAPPSPDYIPGPEDPQAHDPDYVPEPIYPEYIPLEDEHVFPAEEQPLPLVGSPTALSPGYVSDSDLEEDPEEDSEEEHADYPADGGDDDDDDDNDTDDEDEEPFEEEEEEEHLAPADPFDVPAVDPVPSAEDTEELEADEPVPTPPSPPTYRTTARISIRPKAPILLPPEEEVERLLAIPTPPLPPLISLSPPTAEERLARCLAAPALPSSPLPRLPHPYGSPNHVRAPSGFRAAMGRLRASLPLPPPVPTTLPLPLPPLPPLPSSPLPPLPDSLFIPPVDHREDIPEAKLPPCKRLCLTTLASRYEVGESSTAVPRPTGGRRVDYGFVGPLDAEARRQRAEAVGYGIKDTWVDPRETAEEVAPVTLEGVNTRTQIHQTVEALVDDRQYHYETARILDQEALVSREAWAHSMGFSSAVHHELQRYRTHVWTQDHRMDVQDSLIAALTAQVSSLQGHLVTTLGEIRALQAREQARADVPEGTGSSS
ncbi:hypothetical protein Tco_0803937 [Tanacetum coccineum]|uniref:Uncharacterized protein n=1 Tax=Tanacetum coccineum TaxID=301880 RepID=A0ABQ5A2Z1_9ASTR